ncbi:MAG TPA: DUF6152 family protein [Bryobacteraceae bacterium]|jgi:hypothetical protein|nr:DUF6152 family protein [Bryobacteraceae bacterium]
MKSNLSLAILTGGLLLAAIPALAHHSFAAEYDKDKPIKITGSVTKFDLSNPHSWLYLDVAGPDGKVANWACETAAAGGLYRRGFRKDTVKPGMVVSIEGFQAKDSSNTCNAQKMTMPDGSVTVLGTEQNPG